MTVVMLFVPLLNMKMKKKTWQKNMFGPWGHITRGWMEAIWSGNLAAEPWHGGVRWLETTGAPWVFFQLALLESIHVLLQKVHGLVGCSKLNKKNTTNFCVFLPKKRFGAFLLGGEGEVERYHPKESS